MLYWHEKKIARGASRTTIPMFVYPDLLQLLITVDISFYTGHIPSCSTVARAFYQGDTLRHLTSEVSPRHHLLIINNKIITSKLKKI